GDGNRNFHVTGVPTCPLPISDDCDPGGLCGLEPAPADLGAQSLVRAGDPGQPAAGGLGAPAEAELHHAGEGAPAELRAVLLACGCDPAILSALSHQFAARDLRPARHADPDHPA